MGKRNQRKHLSTSENDVIDAATAISAADEQVVFEKDKLLDEAVDSLFAKRGEIREKAYAAIIEALSSDPEHEFVSKYFATLLHQCLNSTKRGSAREAVLACRALGLLALTVGDGDRGSEILLKAIVPIAQAIKSRTEKTTVALVQCLAIITFVGGDDLEETESSMQILWQIALPKSGANAVVTKRSESDVCAAADAWSFLLTTAGLWRMSLKNWIEPLTYFSTLLDHEGDRSVRLTAGYALAAIFHKTGNLGHYDDLAESKGSSEGSDQDGYRIKRLRDKILNQVKDLAVEAAGKGSNKKDLNSQRKLFADLLEFFEDGCFSPESSMKIGREELTTSTWSDLIQLNYLKHFLGGGFAKHVQDNEFLRDVFGLTRNDNARSLAERIKFSKDRILIKARTLELKKDRKVSEMMKAGEYDILVI